MNLKEVFQLLLYNENCMILRYDITLKREGRKLLIIHEVMEINKEEITFELLLSTSETITVYVAKNTWLLKMQ